MERSYSKSNEFLYSIWEIYIIKKKETDMNLYEFLTELRKQLTGKRENMISNCEEIFFHIQWGEL
jgi:hypothetical protein